MKRSVIDIPLLISSISSFQMFIMNLLKKILRNIELQSHFRTTYVLMHIIFSMLQARQYDCYSYLLNFGGGRIVQFAPVLIFIVY